MKSRNTLLIGVAVLFVFAMGWLFLLYRPTGADLSDARDELEVVRAAIARCVDARLQILEVKLAKAAHSASTQCQSNLRQLCAAAIAYTADHGGRFPPAQYTYDEQSYDARFPAKLASFGGHVLRGA